MKYCLTLIFLSLIFAGHSQKVEWAVSEPYPSFVTHNNFVTKDKDGNTVSISNVRYVGMGLYLAKYDKHGDKIWEKNYKGTGSVSSLGVDSAGNIYFTFVIGKITIENNLYISNDGGPPCLIVKHSSNGTVEWVKRYAYYGRLSPLTDSENNFIVTGTYSGTVSVNNTVLYPNPSATYNTFLGKFTSDHDCIWIKTNNGSRSQPIAMNSDSLFYCSDWFHKEFTVGSGANSAILTSTTSEGYCAKYDKAGNLGWVKKMPSLGIVGDVNGNSYILASYPGGGAYVAKYNPAGIFIDTLAKINLDCYKIQFKRSKDGSLFISGGFKTLLSVNDTTIQSSDDNYHAFVIKLSTSGELRWILTSNGGGTGVKDLFIDGAEIYITGDIGGGTSSIGNFQLNQTEGVFTAKIIDEDKSVGTTDTSIPDEREFNLFPNPSNSIFNLHLRSSKNNGSFQAKVTDTQGKIVYIESISGFQGTLTKQINLGHLANGIYFFSLISSQATEVRKIVIE